MKYKLIKLLPFENSPKIGYISEPHCTQKDGAHYWNGLWFNPENYPEFWELVVEKDYEIVSILLQRSDKHQIHNVSEYKNTGYIEALLNCNGNKIHSVKRLSDSEIFTIGDKVVGYNNSIAKIKTIYLVGEISLNIGTDKSEGFSLKNLKKIKKPLFTTEDGVDIFENNTSIYILDKFTIRHIKHKDFNVISKYVKYFSTKEKAEEYILLNKPCLSLNDLKQFFPDTYVPFKKGESATEDVNTKQLEDLVKSKIQQSV